MIPTALSAHEYGWVKVADCDSCNEEGYSADHPHHGALAPLEKRAGESRHPDEASDTLGLHLGHDRKPTGHWYVGQVWLEEPEAFLRVMPKVGASIFQMYLACLGDSQVCPHLHQMIKFYWEQKPIPVDDQTFCSDITPLLIARYLRVLFELCRCHLRVGFHSVEANLLGKVRGRPVIMTQLRQNVARGRLDRIVCRFQIPSLDTPVNQILKAALEQSLKYLRHYSIMESPLCHWASFSYAALSGVSLKRITSQDFKGLHYAGFLKPYREVHQWARLILQLLGYDPLEALSDHKSPALPPFAIDMNELFERYCEVLLRRNHHYKVWAGYRDHNLEVKFQVHPDFLVADGQNRWIIDSKYKENWSWDREDHRADVYQVVAYSRHKGVLRQLDCLMEHTQESRTTLVILYPVTSSSSNPERELDLTGAADGNVLDVFEVKIVKRGIDLPTSRQ